MIIYKFDSQTLSKSFHVSAIKGQFKDINHYTILDRLARGLPCPIQYPVLFKQTMGRVPCDIIDTGMISLILVSDRLRGLIEAHGGNGCSFFSVRVEDKIGVEVPGYHGLSIQGRCGSISYAQSVRLVKPPIYEGGPTSSYLRGQFPDMSLWDGSDVFSPLDNYSIFITEELALPLLNAKLSNCRIRPADEIEVWESLATTGNQNRNLDQELMSD